MIRFQLYYATKTKVARIDFIVLIIGSGVSSLPYPKLGGVSTSRVAAPSGTSDGKFR